MAVGYHSPHLLVRCLCRGSLDSRHFWPGIRRFRILRGPVLLLIPTSSRSWIRHQEGCNARVVTRHDNGLKRWARGLLSRSWYINVWHVIYLGGALTTAGLGVYR